MPHPFRLFSTLLRPAVSMRRSFSRHISRLIFMGLSTLGVVIRRRIYLAVNSVFKEQTRHHDSSTPIDGVRAGTTRGVYPPRGHGASPQDGRMGPPIFDYNAP